MERRGSGGVWLLAAIIGAVLWYSRDTLLNEPAPPFSLPETYGGRVDLASYSGRPVVLVFWMTSCGICRQELPLLSRLAPELRSRGVAIVSVHLGDKDGARDYLRANHIALTALVDEDGRVAEAYHVSAVPKMLLIGRDGKVRRSHSGMTTEATLRQWIDEAGGG